MPPPPIPDSLNIEGVLGAPGAPPTAPFGLVDWVTDGTILATLLLALLAVLLVTALRRCRPAVIWALAGVTIYSLAMRWLLPTETSFTAWPYKRAVPLALAMYEGPMLSLLSDWFGLTIYLDDLVFEANRWMAILSPLALFLHARKLLRDEWSAVVAAALLAVYPSHIRVAASDVLFVQSIFMSSLAFAALYTALEEYRRWWGIVSAIAFPFLAVACYQSRPLNIIFAPLFLAALLFTIKGHAVSRRVSITAGIGVVATAVWSISTYLLRHFDAHVQSGLSLQTLAGFWRTFTSRQNVIFNPWITPVGLMILLLVGGVYLWRRGGSWRLKCVFLVGWFFAFFISHGFVPTSEILVVSRYLLHLAGPTILLAAAATPLLMKLRIWVKIPFGIYLFTVPLLHGHFIGAVDFNQQQEKTFLLESRGVISEGCTVLEYSSPSNNRFGGWFDGFGSRILRAGSRVRDGRIERAWRVGIFQSVEPDAPLSMERILDELELSEDDCLLYYRGFECYIRGSASPPMARPCIALERSFTLEPLVTTRFPARVYDVVFSGYEALEDRSGRFQDSFNNSGRPIELGFFRVTGRR